MWGAELAIMAGMIAIIPLYSLATLAAFFSARTITVYVNGQSGGLYDHYFATFLSPIDLLWSFARAWLRREMARGEDLQAGHEDGFAVRAERELHLADEAAHDGGEGDGQQWRAEDPAAHLVAGFGRHRAGLAGKDVEPPAQLDGGFGHHGQVADVDLTEHADADSVEVLASVEGSPVLVRQGSLLASSFHPEIAGDDRVHNLFVEHAEQAVG